MKRFYEVQRLAVHLRELGLQLNAVDVGNLKEWGIERRFQLACHSDVTAYRRVICSGYREKNVGTELLLERVPFQKFNLGLDFEHGGLRIYMLSPLELDVLKLWLEEKRYDRSATCVQVRSMAEDPNEVLVTAMRIFGLSQVDWNGWLAAVADHYGVPRPTLSYSAFIGGCRENLMGYARN